MTVPLGALVGVGVARDEEWETTTPDRVSVAVAPLRGGGVRAAVSIRF